MTGTRKAFQSLVLRPVATVIRNAPLGTFTSPPLVANCSLRHHVVNNHVMFDWPHAPVHRFSPDGLYFVTASTYQKQHFYRTPSSMDRFLATLFRLTRESGITLQAWTLFSNHYHLVAGARGESLRTMLSQLHSLEAAACNSVDHTPGRKVWFQYRDTQLTFERSWIARLRYTNENPVRHGLVREATRYRWCSAGWFDRNASPAFTASLRRVRIDRVNVVDDFEPCNVEES